METLTREKKKKNIICLETVKCQPTRKNYLLAKLILVHWNNPDAPSTEDNEKKPDTVFGLCGNYKKAAPGAV